MSHSPATTETASRYVVAEWFGQPISTLSSSEQDDLRRRAAGDQPRPPCPFQPGRPACARPDGICSIQPSTNEGEGVGEPVIACPHRFEEDDTILHWLADVVGIPVGAAAAARDVSFMLPPDESSPAGRFDIVVADGTSHRSWWPHLKWFPLELQGAAVASVGGGLPELPELAEGTLDPTTRDWRPDWRLSRVGCLHRINERALMLLRRGSRQVIVIDHPFFDAIGGPSQDERESYREAEVLWLIPRLMESRSGGFKLSRGHWEAVDILESTRMLMPPELFRDDYLESLIGRLEPLA